MSRTRTRPDGRRPGRLPAAARRRSNDTVVLVLPWGTDGSVGGSYFFAGTPDTGRTYANDLTAGGTRASVDEGDGHAGPPCIAVGGLSTVTRRPPNVLFVTADSLRADACGFLGCEHDTTPTLDRLARDGVAFTNAISPGPQTFSSMPAIFTGRHPRSWSYDPDEPTSYWEQRLDAIRSHLDRYATIPERLAAMGYSTAAVSPNPWTSRASGFDRGFDRFVDVSSSDGAVTPLSSYGSSIPLANRSSRLVNIVRSVRNGTSFFASWPKFYDELLQLRETLEEPYFLWVFLLDTHIPYLTPREHRRENSAIDMYYSVLRSQRALQTGSDTVPAHVRARLERSYRDSVRSVDAFVEKLEADFLEDDTVFLFNSDHGESLGEHGNYGHHHRQLYEENVHVPFLVYNTDAAARIDRPVSLTTVPDVVTDIAGGVGFDPASFASEFVVARSESWENTAVRGRRWKYTTLDGRRELYDLRADVEETTNLASAHPQLTAALDSFIEARERQVIEETSVYPAAKSLAAGAKI